MKRFVLDFKKFNDDETGAVTVDWVVLTAGVVSLVAIAMGAIKGNMSSIGDKVEAYLSSVSVP
ncbi:hypothetical protein [Frigidibacter sp. SD6-1]|uniref:hypothetical protein n=1 Tax=Frigidibacter sp. SD6-1 TaxID=3032581 RepID=UPI0024DFA5A3|nr:hypothetical protein [Frigidibacter sp. SD6-1]